MKYKIIAPIENLQLEPNTSIELMKFVFTNHNSAFEAITEGEGFDTYIGETGFSEFFDGAFLYYIGDFDEAGSNLKFKTIPEFLNHFHSKLNFLFNLLWFVKDNSIVINNFYCKDLENNAFYTLASRNSVYDSSGFPSKTKFTLEEAKEAWDLNISVGKHFLKVVDEIPQIPDDIQSRFSNINPTRFFPYNELSRLNRAYMFLSEARRTQAIQSKVSNYIMCLECMFSTDPIEITHKVCERVAFFINDENHAKKTIFELINSAYNVRSKYVHGQKLPSKASTFNQLKELSEKMDDLIRRVFLKIIKTDTDVFSFGDTPLNEYYKDLILK